jgi:hypothetical protein
LPGQIKGDEEDINNDNKNNKTVIMTTNQSTITKNNR